MSQRFSLNVNGKSHNVDVDPGHAAALRAPQRCRPEQPTLLINSPDVAPSGSGEPSIRPVAAAIANAIFDATGVRIRRVPFSLDRVTGALSS